MKNIKFTLQFRGVGFDRKLENKNAEFDHPPMQKITTEVIGPGLFNFRNHAIIKTE